MTDFRSLLERMANELDYLCQLLRDDRREIHALAAEARAALAQPPADGEVAKPSYEELTQFLFESFRSPIEFICDTEAEAHLMIRNHVEFARAALARWGSALVQPIIKRLPDGSQVIEPQDRALLVPQPQPPADGEVAELVARLRDHHTIPTLRERERVADLLERQHQPVPVSERLPETEPVAWMYRGEGRFSGATWFEPLEVTTCLQVAQFRAAPDVPIPLYPAHALPLPSEEEAP